MQCNNCQYVLPPGAPNCPQCSNPTPYNIYPLPSSYGQPPYPPPSQVPYGQPVIIPIPAPPRARSGCSSALVAVLVILLVVICGGALIGGSVLYTQSNDNATATANSISAANYASIDASSTADQSTFVAALTPTPYPPYTESNPPSGSDFSGSAQQAITRAQMASAMNSSYQPTELQSTFTIGQKVYLTYHWENVGYVGYVGMIWYFNGQTVGDILHSDYLSGNYQYYDGYSSAVFGSVGQGAVEIYLCSQSSCSNRSLAWVRPFSVVS